MGLDQLNKKIVRPIPSNDGSGDFIEIPNEMMAELGWQIGDEIDIDKLDDGTIRLRRTKMRRKPHYQLTDLLEEMPDGLPRAEGWEDSLKPDGVKTVIVKKGSVEEFFVHGRKIAEGVDQGKPLPHEYRISFEDAEDYEAFIAKVNEWLDDRNLT